MTVINRSGELGAKFAGTFSDAGLGKRKGSKPAAFQTERRPASRTEIMKQRGTCRDSQKSLRELCELEVRYAYDCEQKLAKKGLPSMIEAASSSELRSALYGALSAFARSPGLQEALGPLAETLRKEKAADAKLTEIGRNISPKAARRVAA